MAGCTVVSWTLRFSICRCNW